MSDDKDGPFPMMPASTGASGLTLRDYFAAAAQMSQLGRQGIPVNQITDAMVGPTAAFWHDTQLPSSFGGYTSLLTQPRVMQIALRYEF